ncbi:putative endonuclease III like protein [Tritrichomonas foetus]|uniref:Endonuclease III like protein n=1 Tax=Tritrichomonas foetus TaxID=1144522 RepID=A0A1J4J8Z9_9EUKA|nr:putative endonuclease III like protein [Tritrichomonas foetus]|eukprot:OHS93885.1 putative endonuclease III like protein [Tritrichomonas foetus]
MRKLLYRGARLLFRKKLMKRKAKEQLDLLIQFRKNELDNNGEDPIEYKDEKNDKNDNSESAKNHRFQILIGLMLSAQTRDEITEQVLKNLNEGFKGGLTPAVLSKANLDTVKKLIKRASFYNKKAERIIEAAKICMKDYDGDIQKTYDGLVALNGVGKKMATLAMGQAWGDRVGIGVDTHIHRIANKLKWVKTKSPNETEDELQKLFDKELWEQVDQAVLYFGQNVCTAVKQRCDICPITKTCPSFVDIEDVGSIAANSKRKKQTKRETKKKQIKEGDNDNTENLVSFSLRRSERIRKKRKFESDSSD